MGIVDRLLIPDTSGVFKEVTNGFYDKEVVAKLVKYLLHQEIL